MRYLHLVQQLIALGAVGVLMLAATPFGQELVVEAGRNIPSADITGDYMAAAGWAIALTLTLLLWPVPRQDRRALLWIWLAKVEVALGFMLYYEWHYGLDAYGYYLSGDPARYLDQGLVFGQGTELMRWLSNLHWRYLVGESYHAMKITFGYIGLAGIYAFYRAACSALQRRHHVASLYLIGLLPSTLQWSGILGKDPITFLGIGMYCAGVVGFVMRRSASSGGLAVAGVIVAAALRPWLAVILLGPLLVFVVVRAKKRRYRAGTVVAGISGFFACLFLFPDAFKVRNVDDVVQRTQVISDTFSYGGSALHSELAVDNTPTKMLLFAPVGVFTALFRPLPGEVLNPFGVIAGLENAMFLALAWLAFRRTRWREVRQSPVVLWAIVLIVAWSVVYGYVSANNLGTGVRFRLQVSPILLCLVVHLSRRRTSEAPAQA